MREARITTIDNPYDPFDQFNEWYMYDIHSGYNTCGRLAKVSKLSDQLSDAENARENERAIDALIAADFRKIYKKVIKETNKLSHVPVTS